MYHNFVISISFDYYMITCNKIICFGGLGACDVKRIQRIHRKFLFNAEGTRSYYGSN